MFFLMTSLLQSQEQDLNFVIKIDSKLDIALSDMTLVIDNNEYPLTYYPGVIKMKKDIYDKAKQGNAIKLKFTWNEIDYRKYSLELNNSWINSNYFILSIYNLDKKCNRKVFGKQKDGRKYIYEYSSSEGSELLPRKKNNRKYNCSN
jgi:hypothetical protein